MARIVVVIAALFVATACASRTAEDSLDTTVATPTSVPSNTTVGDVQATTTTSTETGTSTSLAISVPAEGPTFGDETGVLLLLDDGIDGVTAVDLDRRLAGRSVVEGQRAGDEQYSMVKVGKRLVVGWGEPHSVDLSTRVSTSLGPATIFIPAAEPDRVWMVDYPGGRIGQGDPHVWQVDVVTGEPLTETERIPSDLYPDIGTPGGLALQSDTGISLWDSESNEITPLEGNGPGFSHDVHTDDLAWCRGDCSQLLLTEVDSLTTKSFDPPHGYDMFLTSRFSPDGKVLAALVGRRGGDYVGEALWLLDRDTETISVRPDPTGHAEFLTWAPDGDQLFATSYSYRENRTVVWRYRLSDEEFSSIVLPFGGALSLVVIDNSFSDAYIGELIVDPSQCHAPGSYPSGRTGICTFEY